MPGGADYPMATTEHHLGKTIKDIYIFILGLNAALNYLLECVGDSELHPVFLRILQDTNLFLDQHDQLKTFLDSSEHGPTALSRLEMRLDSMEDIRS